MTITSHGTFKLFGNEVTVDDSYVTDTAIILVGFQDSVGVSAGSCHGHFGISARVPGTSFTFSSPRPASGARVGYVIYQP